MYEEIIAEIERRRDAAKNYDMSGGDAPIYDDLLAFIESLPKPSEDLEKAAKSHTRKVIDAAPHPGWDWDAKDVVDAFKAGAQWQKEQMMKDAVEGVVQDRGEFINFGDGKYIDLDPTMQLRPVFDLKDGDKVKIIIIKD